MDSPSIPKRRWLFRFGKRLKFGIDALIAAQSKVGNPPVFAAELFPWVDLLERNCSVIRAEVDALLTKRETIPTFHDVSPDQRLISHGQQWRSFFLWGVGYRAEANCQRCPQTAAVLENIPGLVTAFFSILAPAAHIPAHAGLTKQIVNCHLPLIVPQAALPGTNGCRMRVDNQIVHWQSGKCVVFDDTYMHEVWNETAETRVVLLLQVKRPVRQPARMLGDFFLWAVRRTGYVQEARRNIEKWESAQQMLEKAR